MTMFMARSVRRFLIIKAAQDYLKEILPAGIENLKDVAESGRSIFTTYISKCSEEEKTQKRQELAGLLQMGVTIDMILEEAARQEPRIAPIMKSMDSYRKAEIARVMAFLKGG